MEPKLEIVEIIEPTPVKRESVFEKLTKRNKERQNYLETKLEQRSPVNEAEDVQFFSHSFTEGIKQIDCKLMNIVQNSTGKSIIDLELTECFAAVNSDIQELQRYLSQSTIFLPDYNIKAFQNYLNELQSRSEDTRQKLMPKKKFGFNKKINNSNLKIDHNFVDKVDGGITDTYVINGSSGKKWPTADPIILKQQFDWTICDRKNEYIILLGNDVDSKDVTITNLENCLIEIQGHPGSVQISNAENCLILCGPVSRSIFMENIQNTKLVAACQQLRLHSSVDCKLWLHVTCRAIIEDCHKIDIGCYNYEYSGIECDFKKAGLDQNVNNFRDIADFNWLSTDHPSPNWKMMDNRMQLQNWDVIKDRFKQL